jgi:hypothetical protein
MTDDNTDIFGEVIYAYTRQQAIEDGVLIDVSPLAKEAGFKCPVALTAAAWAEAVEIPPGVEGQDETGRLWDVLNVLMVEIRRHNGACSEIRFAVHVRNDNRDRTPPLVDLKSLAGPGDNGELVVTILLPNED